MAFKIGFISESDHKSGEVCADPPKQAAPRRSVVQVYFPARHRTLAYYNDRFDLRQGDLVFVDGKLEGKQGRVEEASYNFGIRLSDYQRVIAVAERGHDYYCRNLVRCVCRRNIRGSRKDTAENLGLAMRVNGELYPVRMTAYKSLLDRAKIGGTAKNIVAAEDPDDKLRDRMYDDIDRVIVFDNENLKIEWKFDVAFQLP